MKSGRRLGRERLGAVCDRSDQHGALRVQPHLQARNLLQVKTAQPQPVDEAVSGALAQGRDLTNMWRDTASKLVKKSGWNEIGRSGSVAMAGGGGKLGDGMPALAQNIPDAFDPSVPATLRYRLFTGGALAKSGSRARYPEHSMHCGGRVHPTILARLLLYERQPGATSLGAPFLALKDFAGWPRTCPLPGEGHTSTPAPFTVRAPHLEESNQHTFRTIRV